MIYVDFIKKNVKEHNYLRANQIYDVTEEFEDGYRIENSIDSLYVYNKEQGVKRNEKDSDCRYW